MCAGGDSHFWRTTGCVSKSIRQCLWDHLAAHLHRAFPAETLLDEDDILTMVVINENDQGVSFAVRVHPRAKKNGMTGEVGGALKLSLTTPPIEGRANEACVEFFAKLLKVPRSSVTIASGQSSRNKVIRVMGVTAQFVRDELGI